MRHPARIILSLGIVLAPSLASAQAAERFGGSSESGSVVEVGVSDRDPLRASQRRVEPGNAQHSFAARLTVADFRRGWSPLNPATPIGSNRSTGLPQSQAFEYNSPGMRALMDRPEYMRDGKGDVVPIIPANTVFQLTIDKPVAADPIPAAHDNFVDFRQSFRPDPALLHRVPGSPTVAGSPIESSGYDTTNWRFPQAAVANIPPGTRIIRRTAKPTASDRGSDVADTTDATTATDAATPTPDSKPLTQDGVVDQPNP